MSMSNRPRLDSASFRDRTGRVYVSGEEVYRGLSDEAWENWKALDNTRFFHRNMESGSLVSTQAIDFPEQDVSNDWPHWLKHQKLPFISYPYEWSFSMLKDAALLHLGLLRDALREEMTMKDGTPYNVQFVGPRPIFIDIPSFEKWRSATPWIGYKQFCEMFLNPLFFQAYKGIDFQPLLKAYLDGIPVDVADRVFSWTGIGKRGVLSHVFLQNKLNRKLADSQKSTRKELEGAGFNRRLVQNNVEGLIKLISNLEWSRKDSEWADYDSFHNYTEEDHERKAQFIRDSLSDIRPNMVWDLGCNTGQFSLIASEFAKRVIAIDGDHGAVDRLYQELRKSQVVNVQPIVLDLANPSPDHGWRGRERTSLQSRNQPDMLLALALVHHLVISANVPVQEVIEWFYELSDHLIIEHVGKADEKVKTLCLNKVDNYDDYDRPNFESILSSRFRIIRQIDMSSGNRRLYLCVADRSPS